MNKHKIKVLSIIVVACVAVVALLVLLYNWSNYLDVSSIPSGADVKFDGIYKGTTPCRVKWLKTGNHSLEISKSGYKSFRTSMYLEGGFDSFHFSKSLVKYADISPAGGRTYGHEWVDLGLSVKWARCNLGAKEPQMYGYPYAWGEVWTKEEFKTGNSKTYGYGRKGYYNFDIRGNASLDAARANWGGSWRLPTKAEFQELIDNCEWTYSIATSFGPHQEMTGYTVTSKMNGNSIFLPTYLPKGHFMGIAIGTYWASTTGSDSNHAWSLRAGSIPDLGESERYIGCKIRPVTK